MGVGVVLDSGTSSQSTSLSTSVTSSNTNSGTITTEAASTAAGACESFQVSNSKVAATSVVMASMKSYAGSNGFPMVYVKAVAAGSFDINVCNLATGSGTTSHTAGSAGATVSGTWADGGGALDGAIAFNFAVINPA